MGNCINVPTPHAGAGVGRSGKAAAGASRGMQQQRQQQQQQQPGKGQPDRAPHLESGGSASSSTNGSTIGKRRIAAGAPMARPRVPQTFLTRKGSEFGVVRPEQVKITSRYTILEKLGEGNTAVVRRCVDKRDGKEYAVKIFRKSKLSLVDVTGLLEEVSILAHLKHPNVTAYVDFLEDSWYYYLVLELVRGGELFDRITRKTTYTEKEARDLFCTLVGTIEYLHSCNVVHRDIKPENLLLAEGDDDCTIKLADFGYASQVWDDEPGLRSQCGTPCYIAPEILKREYYGKAVDMWSIGVVLYILLCGYAPFYDEDQKRLFERIKRGQFCFDEDAWGDISGEAKDLISCLLELDPAKRLTAKAALRHPWVLVADDKLTSHALNKAQSELRKFNARRKFRASVRSIIMVHRIRRLSAQRRSPSPPPCAGDPASPAPAVVPEEEEEEEEAAEAGMRRLMAAARSVDAEAKLDASKHSSSSGSGVHAPQPMRPNTAVRDVREMMAAVADKAAGRTRESSGGSSASTSSEATTLMTAD